MAPVAQVLTRLLIAFLIKGKLFLLHRTQIVAAILAPMCLGAELARLGCICPVRG